MREIKFRAWDGVRMYFWGLMPDRFVGPPSSGRGNPLSMKHMQFTGLLDRNGREVWEGDILLTDEGGWIAQVDFVRGCFVLQNHTVKMGGFSVEPNWEECEVIGTVWENPELLEDK